MNRNMFGMLTLMTWLGSSSIEPYAWAAPVPPRPSDRTLPAPPPAPGVRSRPAAPSTPVAPIEHTATSLPKFGAKVKLDTLLEHARKQAPDIIVARANIAHGDAAIEAAKPLFVEDPWIYGGFGARFTTGERTWFEFQSQLQQTIELAGERRLRLQAARKLKKVTEAQLEQALWDLERIIRSAYREALVARERVHAADRVVEFSQHMLEIARIQFEQGAVSVLPVRLSEAQVAQAQQLRIAATYGYFALCQTLAELSGWPADSPPEPIGELPPALEVPADVDLVALAHEKLPEYRTLLATVDQAHARVRSTRRDVFPQPAVGIYVAREVDPFARVGMTVGLGVLSLNLPIWQRNRGARAQAQADLTMARGRQTAWEREIQARVRRASAGVNAAAERVKVYAAGVLPRFEENLKLLRQAFELGEIDLMQVSLARQRFLEIQADALNTYADYYRAVAELEGVLGTIVSPTGFTPSKLRDKP